MNSVLQPVFARRSIRKYADREVSEDLVHDILEAAMAAPSAVAKDPWEFIVLREREMMVRVAEALPNGKMLGEAAVGIIVCGDIERAHANELSYMIQDCSAAIQNILLSVSMLGLGACWLGVHPRQERVSHIKGLFNLPENIIPLAAIAIGYPAEEKEPRTRFSTKFIHVDKW